MNRRRAALAMTPFLALLTFLQTPPAQAAAQPSTSAATHAPASAAVSGAVGVPRHPFGNFSVNRYHGLVVAPGELRVDHVQDLAEIPTAQAGARLKSDPRGWAAERCAEAARSLTGTSSGRPLTFTVRSSSARLTPGQAGLPTSRVECALTARITNGPLTLQDNADAVGWREITARGDRMTLTSADVPATSRSRRLTSYPSDLLSSPLSQRSAGLRIRTGGPALSDPAESPVTKILPRGADKPAQAFADLVADRRLTLGFGVTAILIAIVLGAMHAVAPGHGKTIMAAYAVSQGRRARRDIITLGVTVTLTHTAGVLALGVIVLSGTVLAPSLVFGGLGVASGLLVAFAGGLMLRRAVHAYKHGHTHTHTHGFGHGHHHDFGHGHPHGHGHGHHEHDDHGRQHHDEDHEHAHGGPDELEPKEESERDDVLVAAAGHDHAHTERASRRRRRVDAAAHRVSAEQAPARKRRVDGAAHHASGEQAEARTRGSAASVAVLAREPAPETKPESPTKPHHERKGHSHGPSVRGRGAALMGFAGGMVPSPSAVLVLVGAAAIGRAWFGVLLVIAYGVGLALTLIGVGALVMGTGRALAVRLADPERRPRPLRRVSARVLPMATSAAVLLLGIALALRSLPTTFS
ncbi:hypothetical protein [Spirillospora sp. NPDC047279]|uniref:HoxN/HupN/NixA family nickel/cobalt transporter n=1 Tax=Spirillospora sp. NPDC047279 TaxID=3155478 RepID=UPI0033CB9FE5